MNQTQTQISSLKKKKKKKLFDLQFEGSFMIWVFGIFGFIGISGFFYCKFVLGQILFFFFFLVAYN